MFLFTDTFRKIQSFWGIWNIEMSGKINSLLSGTITQVSVEVLVPPITTSGEGPAGLELPQALVLLLLMNSRNPLDQTNQVIWLPNEEEMQFLICWLTYSWVRMRVSDSESALLPWALSGALFSELTISLTLAFAIGSYLLPFLYSQIMSKTGIQVMKTWF